MISLFWEECLKFLSMGGYAWYVWPAYGVAIAVLLINIYMPIKKGQRILRHSNQQKNVTQNVDGYDASDS